MAVEEAAALLKMTWCRKWRYDVLENGRWWFGEERISESDLIKSKHRWQVL